MYRLFGLRLILAGRNGLSVKKSLDIALNQIVEIEKKDLF